MDLQTFVSPLDRRAPFSFPDPSARFRGASRYGGAGAMALGGFGYPGVGRSPLDNIIRGGRPYDSMYSSYSGRRGYNYGELSSALTRPNLSRDDPMLALALAAKRGYPPNDLYGFNRDRDCDCRLRGLRCERDSCYRDLHSCGRSFCSCSGSDSKKEFPFKTKDISVRGKTYAIRKSFLADAGKFESDLGKFMEKKKEEEVPDQVVQILVDFINTEECKPGSVLDLVTMSILASNLGVKSAVEYSLASLKKGVEWDRDLNGSELADVCIAIMLSSKVDDGLKDWLKKYLTYDGRFWQLARHPIYESRVASHPELHTRLEAMLGLRTKESDDGLRIL